MSKVAWSGTVAGVQPRIDLGRSFDESYHSYLGYLLVVEGEIGGEPRAFTVRIGPGAQGKHAFRAGDRVSGIGQSPRDPEAEVTDLYKASSLEVLERAPAMGRRASDAASRGGRVGIVNGERRGR